MCSISAPATGIFRSSVLPGCSTTSSISGWIRAGLVCFAIGRKKAPRTCTSASRKRPPSCSACTRRSTRPRNTCSTTIPPGLTLRAQCDDARRMAEVGVARRGGPGVRGSLRSNAHSPLFRRIRASRSRPSRRIPGGAAPWSRAPAQRQRSVGAQRYRRGNLGRETACLLVRRQPRRGAGRGHLYLRLFSEGKGVERGARRDDARARAAASSTLRAKTGQSRGRPRPRRTPVPFFRERLSGRLGRQRHQPDGLRRRRRDLGPVPASGRVSVSQHQHAGERSAAAIRRRRDRLAGISRVPGKIRRAAAPGSAGPRDPENASLLGAVLVAAGDRAAIGSRGGGFHALRGGSTQPHPDDPDERRWRALEHAGQDGVAESERRDRKRAARRRPLAARVQQRRGKSRRPFARDLGGFRRHLARRAPARRRSGLPRCAGCRILVPVDRAGPGRRDSRALHLGALPHQARAFQHGVAGGKALMLASDAFGLFGCGVLGLAVVATLIPLRRLPAGARYAVMLAAAFALFIPFGDLPAAAYLRGVTGDVSVTTLILAGAAGIARLTGKALIEPRDREVLCQLIALAAAFLYPFALGWTQFDPYALGYGSVGFVTVLLMVTLSAWRAKLYAVVFIVIAAALAYLAGACESRNLWDYLIDPLVSVYALVRLLSGVRHRLSGKLTQAAG